jgi:L-iditol 2-dehydrogenase
VNRLALLPGDFVLVAGQGPVGLMFTRLLVLRGMNVVASDCFDSRLRFARQFGARWPFLVGAAASKNAAGSVSRQPGPHSGDLAAFVHGLTRGRGLDAAVVAVASDAVVRQSQELVRLGGQVMLFAHTRRGDEMPLDLAKICVDEKDLVGSYSADFLLQKEVASLVFSRRLDVRPLITHRYPLEQTAAAIRLASHPSEDSLKVVVVGEGAES